MRFNKKNYQTPDSRFPSTFWIGYFSSTTFSSFEVEIVPWLVLSPLTVPPALSTLPLSISSTFILASGPSVSFRSSSRVLSGVSAVRLSEAPRYLVDGKLTLSSSEAVKTDVIMEKNIDTPKRTTTARRSSIMMFPRSVGACPNKED